MREIQEVRNDLSGGEEEVDKAEVPDRYPPEEGDYLRGNDYSPVAVVVVLNQPYEKVPEKVEKIVRSSVEAGAAIAGTLQTENIGAEKVIANVIANPNIRYAVLCGIESRGHLTGEAFTALIENGTNEEKKIMGTDAPHPFLYNIPPEAIERFRNQIDLVDLMGETDIELIEEAVQACFQERPTEFKNYELYDLGAYPEPPICQSVTWRIDEPWTVVEPKEHEKQVTFNVVEEIYQNLKKLAQRENLRTPEKAAKEIIQKHLTREKSGRKTGSSKPPRHHKIEARISIKNPTIEIEEFMIK